MATQAQLAAVQQLYVGYLGRAADSAGQQFWANAIANGTATIASVATGFTLSAEYKAAYGGLSTDALVEKVYNNVLGRTPDAEGKAFWVAALANGTVTADTLVATMVTNLGALDQQTINNKVFVAQTYTDTVGDAYTPEGGAAVLVGVDNTAASVATAVAAINNGTLPGQVPGLALINAVDTALAAQVAFETAGKADVDALVAKLAATTDADGDAQVTLTDSITATSTYADKVAAVVADAAANRAAVNTGSTNGVLVGDKDTSVIESRAVTAQKAVDTAISKLSATEKTAVSGFTSALTAQAAAEKAVATATEKGAAIGGLDADASADAGLATLGTPAAGGNPAVPATAADVYANYVNGTAAERLAIDAALKDSSFYSTFKAAAVKDANLVDANAAVSTAVDKLDNSAEGNAYLSAYQVKFATDATLVIAKAADADVAAAKVIADAYAVKTDAVADAVEAVGDFNAGNTVTIHELSVNTTAGANLGQVTDNSLGGLTGLSSNKDVFYFGTSEKANVIAADSVVKAALIGASDFTIGGASAASHFGVGDSIVLNSTLTYNSGALSTGDNNKAEFFLVQKGTDTLVVIETANYGSASVTGTAAAATTLSPDAAVITLTGVAVTDLSVSNGVISHVA